MNPVLLFAVVALGQDPPAQDLAKSITFSSLAAPAQRLVSDLGAKAGLKLDVSPQVAPDVLFVQASEVKLKDLLERIAQAVNGEWATESDGTLRLIRPAGNANREIAAEREEKVAALRAELKRYFDSQNKPPAKPGANPAQKPTDEEAQEMAIAMMGGDGAKHILPLLQRIDVADLVLEHDGRIVYSSNPTRMQRRLPGNLEPIVADMVRAHNEEIAARKANPDDPPDEEMRQWLEFAKQFGFDRDPKPLQGRPAKLLLVAEQPELYGGLSLSLRLYDQAGKVAIESGMNMGFQGFLRTAVAMNKPAAAPDKEDHAIDFSDTTKELEGIFKSFTAMSNRAKMSAALEARLLRPDVYDPLSFSISDSLVSIAKYKKLNVVASLPDSFTSFMEMFAAKGGTVNGFLADLESSEQVKATKKDGWLVVQPKHPVQARRERVDRPALARLLAAAKKNGLASLDDIAAYALTSPSPYEGSAAMPYLMLFAPNAMQQGMMGLSDWNALRLYGTLNQAQRQNLASGGRIAIGSLGPNQQALLSRMVFGAKANLKVQDPNAKPKEELGIFDIIRTAMPGQGGGNDFREEPTEVMPNGLPGQGYLSGTFRTEPIGKSEGSDPMLMFGALGPDELAMLRYFKEDPKLSAVAGMMPSIDRMRLGERTNILLKVFVAEDVALERTLPGQPHRPQCAGRQHGEFAGRISGADR